MNKVLIKRMSKEEKAVWFAVLNSLTKEVLYRFSKDQLKIDVPYNLEKFYDS